MRLTKRQEEILGISMKIISKEGIEGLTIKNIARNIGITEAAIYRHFVSKEAILMAILNYFEDMAKNLLSSIQLDKSGGLDKIYRILKNRCEEFIKNPALIVVILSEEIFPSGSSLAMKVSDIMMMNQRIFSEIIEQSLYSGEIRKDIGGDAILYMILGTFRFIVTRWRLSDYKSNLFENFNKYWTALVKVLKKV